MARALTCWLSLALALLVSHPSVCLAQSSRATKEMYRRLAMEHVDCAMLYLASSVCRQSEAALAARLRRDFETMMLRAKRFAAEGGVEDRTITTYGKEVLEEMNNDIGGDCKGMSVFEDKHRVCKALAEDFTPRGRQILQDLSNGR